MCWSWKWLGHTDVTVVQMWVAHRVWPDSVAGQAAVPCVRMSLWSRCCGHIDVMVIHRLWTYQFRGHAGVAVLHMSSSCRCPCHGDILISYPIQGVFGCKILAFGKTTLLHNWPDRCTMPRCPIHMVSADHADVLFCLPTFCHQMSCLHTYCCLTSWWQKFWSSPQSCCPHTVCCHTISSKRSWSSDPTHEWPAHRILLIFQTHLAESRLCITFQLTNHWIIYILSFKQSQSSFGVLLSLSMYFLLLLIRLPARRQ